MPACSLFHRARRRVEHGTPRGIATSDIKNKKGRETGACSSDPDDNELCLWEYAEPEDAREIVKSAVLHG